MSFDDSDLISGSQQESRKPRTPRLPALWAWATGLWLALVCGLAFFHGLFTLAETEVKHIHVVHNGSVERRV